MVNNHGIDQGRSEFAENYNPKQGDTLKLTIDQDLQFLCEKLIDSLKGAIIVMEPKSGEIYAINLSNGQVIWNDNLSTLIQKKSIENISDIRGNAVIQNDIVYVISHNGKMLAMNLNSGKRLWESNIVGIQTPWVVSKFIYVLSKDNELICLTSSS